MKVILHSTANAPWQQLTHEWYGTPMEPPVDFRFQLTATELIFSARRPCPALLHPEARENRFQTELWKYDTTEFFVANVAADRYLEFNLSPNGAWWAAAFTGPRVVDERVPAVPQGVITRGHADAQSWECEARFPLAYLELMGIHPGQAPCRMAATAILNSPDYHFLTTAEDQSGKPDFHRPWAFALAELQK